MTYSPIYRLNLALRINFQLPFPSPYYQSICKKKKKKSEKTMTRLLEDCVSCNSYNQWQTHTKAWKQVSESGFVTVLAGKRPTGVTLFLLRAALYVGDVTEFLKTTKNQVLLNFLYESMPLTYQLHKWNSSKGNQRVGNTG